MMAGFFGFFNFEKEGPGISKDAPKKKNFIVFFETFFRNIWRFMIINIVYVVMCIPVITSGCAGAGMTNVTRNIARDKHSFGLSDFFSTIAKNLKQSLAVGIINVLLTALIGFALWFYYKSYTETSNMFSAAGFGVVAVIAMAFLFMKFYIYTLMVTFDFKLKALYVNSFKFAIINLKKNVVCGILLLLIYTLYAIVAYIFAETPLWAIEVLVAVLTLPAFRFLMLQYFTFPAIKKYIIDPYYEAHPEADIQKRRDLGIEVGDDSASDADFNDIG